MGAKPLVMSSDANPPHSILSPSTAVTAKMCATEITSETGPWAYQYHATHGELPRPAWPATPIIFVVSVHVLTGRWTAAAGRMPITAINSCPMSTSRRFSQRVLSSPIRYLASAHRNIRLISDLPGEFKASTIDKLRAIQLNVYQLYQ